MKIKLASENYINGIFDVFSSIFEPQIMGEASEILKTRIADAFLDYFVE